MTFRKACRASLTGFETHFVQSHQNPGASGRLWCQQNPPASALKVTGWTDVRFKTGFPSNTACLVLKPAVQVTASSENTLYFSTQQTAASLQQPREALVFPGTHQEPAGSHFPAPANPTASQAGPFIGSAIVWLQLHPALQKRQNKRGNTR